MVAFIKPGGDYNGMYNSLVRIRAAGKFRQIVTLWAFHKWVCAVCRWTAAVLETAELETSELILHGEEGGAPSIITTGHHGFIVRAAADAEIVAEGGGILFKNKRSMPWTRFHTY